MFAGTSAASESALSLPSPQLSPGVPVRFEGVQPVNEQPGANLSNYVPDGLAEPLFGVSVTQARSRPQPGDIPATDSEHWTYAVLDAGRILHLPERLDGSGLRHRCLFSGRSQQDMGDVAPWLVELDPTSPLTRDLFSRGEATHHLWSAYPGLFIRTPARFEMLWAHLRKFTRLRDESGRWLYFRFWEPTTFSTLSGIAPSEEPWLGRFFGNHQFFWPDSGQDGTTWFGFCRRGEDEVASPLVLGPVVLAALEAAVRRRRETEDVKDVRARLRSSAPELDLSDEFLASLRSWLQARGFRSHATLRPAMHGLARRFPEGSPPDPGLLELLSDRRKGAGLRLWHIENWKGGGR
ncbi:DUF4123 domain-containing protein [Oceanicola sp. D3]|uniref:DUF4123 domain-containing protein n=1 Tax=Oceanicola sp. D3 TaxID=2587163 RepID=UPI00143CDC25|nr:DUF4123 domain-containing protein [Oceanicola sp. D3]